MAGRFLRVETRRPRLSVGVRFSQFGSVSAWSHWQALVGPFMVELFAAGFSSPRRRPRSKSRSRPSPGRELPTPAELSEPRGPDPSDGISTRFEPSRPRCKTPRHFPVAPPRRGEPRNPVTPERPRSGIAALRRSDRTSGLEPSTSRGFGPMSLRRAGRARLHAPSSTGHTFGGWLVPPP